MHGDEGLWLLSWNVLVGDSATTEVLRPLVSQRVYSDFAPNFFIDLFFGHHPVSEGPFRSHPQLPHLAYRHTGLIEAYRAEVSGSSKLGSELLFEYVGQQWLANHQGASWYGDHRPGFAGYWAFEAAAVAKLASIDDSALVDHPFYPHDLAHSG